MILDWLKFIILIICGNEDDRERTLAIYQSHNRPISNDPSFILSVNGPTNFETIKNRNREEERENKEIGYQKKKKFNKICIEFRWILHNEQK